MLYLEDQGGLFSLNELPAPTTEIGWRELDAEIASFGFDSSVFWFYARVHSSAALDQWLLEIGNPLLDEVDVFVIHQGRLQNRFKTGDRQLFNDRPIYHRNFIFPLEISAGRSVDLYVRVKSTTSLQVPMTLWQPQEFERQDQIASLWLWSYFGLMGGIAIYNFFIYLILRDRSYLYYVLFLTSSVFYFGCLRGFVYQYVFETQPQWNEHALPVAVFSSLLFASLFAKSFLRIRRFLPHLAHVLNAIAVSVGVVALASLVLPYSLVAMAAAVATLFCGLFFIYIGLAMVRQDHAPARYFAVAWAIFVFAVVIFALAKLGLAPRTVLNDSAPILGSALEALLLSFGLAARFNLMKERVQNVERERFQVEADHRLKRMGAMRTLIAGVAHQFNTPIGNGVTAISLLQDESKRLQNKIRSNSSGLTSEQAKRFLHLANSSATLALQSFDRAANLVRRFKQVAIDDYRESLSPFQLRDCFKKAIGPLQKPLDEEGIELHCDCPESLLCVGFPNTLAEVVSELIDNAIHHAFHEPHDVEERPPLIEVSAGVKDGQVSITVADNGLGIVENDPSRVLDPFYSTKRGSGGKVGLGLFVVYTIVTQHFHGSMEVVDSGSGATITMKFAQDISGHYFQP